ncbi:seminal metalloprotease 1 [Papilio machaon]|uniref:seminal metalloprotease 1 n=1 Tax=Papilio machaon TaxID=76193 RepID=UPI001E665C38|nr:seminal metalloprotease 1 [Papilio machaon]
MLRAVVVLCVVGLAAASPVLVRTDEEVQAFRDFLESTKSDDASQFMARSRASPSDNAEENSGKYQGDIVLDDVTIESMVKEYAMGRNAYVYPGTKWPENTVVWEYAEDQFDDIHKAAIEDGIKHIENSTCIKFRYRQPEDTNYVSLTGLPNGCYAHVGYWEERGVHTMNLALNTPGVGCFRHGTIVHEFMHIIGFFHMQSTHDRDDYVHIATENIISGMEHNFDIYTSELVNNLDIEYDYVSCLHYGPRAFSANGEDTIIPLREHEGVMGQRVYITDKDWLRINRHYNCQGAWN